jgi:hypothetical protein
MGCTKAEQTKAERLKQIDAQLATWAPTGRPEDAQKRVALKAERALLAADLGYATSTVMPVSAPVVAATPVKGAPYALTAPVTKENRWDPMTGDSRWMDPTSQTRTHNGTIYGNGYYQTHPRP